MRNKYLNIHIIIRKSHTHILSVNVIRDNCIIDNFNGLYVLNHNFIIFLNHRKKN